MTLFEPFLALGCLFLIGLAADQIGRRTLMPRVTLLLLCGAAFGESGFRLIPAALYEWSEFLSISALAMVAFLLGGALKLSTLRIRGAAIAIISLSIVLVTMLVVGAGLWGLGLHAGLALLLAAIATATAPAATNDVIRQSGVKSAFADTLRGVVAIDDAWGLMAFSVALVIAGQLAATTADAGLFDIVWDIGGAIILGVLIGLPGAYLTGRISDGEPLETEALGLVFITAGCALWLDVSFLIAGMTAGGLIVNFAKHHTKAFHEIEHIQWPFMVLFFILAGASLEISAVQNIGLLGLAYIALRVVARLLGGWLGAKLSDLPAEEHAYVGLALLPQAGVAIGMALVAAQNFPEWAPQIMAVTIGTTIVFEIFGPVATLLAIRKVAQKAERQD